MSASGAKVMALRSIEVARSYGVKLRVRSTFVDGEGTWIGEEDNGCSRRRSSPRSLTTPPRRRSSSSTSPTARRRGARLSRARRRGREHRHDRAERLGGRHDRASRSRCRRRTSRPPTRSSTRSRLEIGARGVERDPTSRKISLIGAGMKSHPGRSGRHVRRARRGGHQHRDHLDVVDPGLVRGQGSRGRAGGAAPCTTRFRTFAEERVDA